MNKFVFTPSSISFSILKNKGWGLSPSIYKRLNISNPNLKPLSSFLRARLNNSHLGTEVGSLNYIEKSTHYFLKTKALQNFSYIPQFTEDSLTPIFPCAFTNMHLSEGDILLSKDGNIGEVVILDKDYPNICLSGAIYRLPLQDKWRYYILAFIKHDIFREQLDYIVPKGATIRHAKKLFLDCLIPLPNHDAENAIKYVDLLTRAIVDKEISIKRKHREIVDIFDVEIKSHQSNSVFSYELPRFSKILEIRRLDCARYTIEFMEFQHLLENYSGGCYTFESDGYDCKRGQNLQISSIGQSVYSDIKYPGFYRLILSKHISPYSSINDCQFLGNPNSLSTLKRGDIVLSARGDIGRVYILPYSIPNTITNIDSLVFSNSTCSVVHSIYNAMFLNYLRVKGHISRLGINGSGAPSLTKYQVADIIIPNFPKDIQNQIATLYQNKVSEIPSLNLETFLDFDSTFNSEAGIFEINISLLQMKKQLSYVLECIAKNTPFEFTFNFYNKIDF